MRRIMFLNNVTSFMPVFAANWVAPQAVKTSLSYTLKKAEGSLIFQVNDQSEDITAFLKKNHYRAKNGLLISSDQYPEFKDSTNTIYLRGSNTGKANKLDVTRFVGNMQRDSKFAMIEEALAEFVDYVKSLRPYWALIS